jgi:CDP-diacylglycerol--glycerol-3-phosphate 3-phosphatidyltransferase
MAPSLRRTLPNAITVGRLVLAATFFTMVDLVDRSAPGVQTTGFVAGILFAIAAATDVLDGYLARRWKVVSVFGRLMDPLVDKVLVLGGFIYLASPAFAPLESPRMLGSGIEAWMVVVILLREFLVTGLRSYAESRGIAFGADWGGKIKMVVQCFCIPWCVFTATRTDPAWGTVLLRDVAIWTTMAATILSAVSYVARAMKIPLDAADGAQP